MEELLNDPVALRLPLLIPLAKQLEKTADPEARDMLKMGMSLVLQSVAPKVRRAQIIPIEGGQDEPEA